MFDPEMFLGTSTSDATSTEYVPIPVGVYVASAEKVEVKQMESGSVALNVTWKIDAPEEEDADGRSVRQTVWLNLTPSGALNNARGKNPKLGMLRAALGQNVPGVPWSPSQIVGSVARIEVYHRPDREDPSRLYEDVKAVTSF